MTLSRRRLFTLLASSPLAAFIPTSKPAQVGEWGVAFAYDPNMGRMNSGWRVDRDINLEQMYFFDKSVMDKVWRDMA